MKNLYFISLFLFSLLNLASQNYYMANPEGFGENTTGGGSAAPVTVSTYADLKASIKLSTPQVILVSGTITFSATETQISETVVNKTIIGLPGARLINNKQTQAGSGILNLKGGSSNVIIRNLIFEGPGAYDVDGRDNLSVEGCINLWVDHCEFQDGTDGNFDIKNTTDNVTVSWCKFIYLKPAVPGGPGGSNDHRFSNLIGSSDTNAPADGHFSVTFQNCYWSDGCKERMPRARNSELHILNCYYDTNVSNSRALGFSGGINTLSCYVENSNFENIGTVYQSYGGTVALNFDNCLNARPDIGTVSKPTYNYTVLPVNDVATYVSNSSCGAGATLLVTANGVISSSCDSLGVEDDVLRSAITYYPTLVDDTFNIDFSDSLSGMASINVYSISGQKIQSFSRNISSKNKVSIDLSNFTSGVYLCALSINNASTTFKIVKR